MEPSNDGTIKRIILYIFGISLIFAAIIIILKGAGILPAIPGFVIWALILIAIGAGILGGINSSRF